MSARRSIARRAPVKMTHRLCWAIAVLLLAAWSSPAEAVRIPRKSLTKTVARSAVKGKVKQVVANDPQAMRGLVRMARFAAREGQSNRDAVRAVARAISKLAKDPTVGPAQTRQLLRDFNELALWASRQAPPPAGVRSQADELASIVRDFTKTKTHRHTGAWYEIHLASRFAKRPPTPPPLTKIQPSHPDKKLFRDFEVRKPDGTLVHVEAKNYRHMPSKLARKKLCRQSFSHIRRMRAIPERLRPPPLHELSFTFNHRAYGPALDPSWVKTIQLCTRRALLRGPPRGPGLSLDNANRWINNHLHIRRLCFPPVAGCG